VTREPCPLWFVLLLATAPPLPAQPVAKEARQAPVVRSTRAGVFTDAQAKRGADVYVMSCKSCHTPASHTGETFATWWKDKPLGDLLGFVSTKMPKNDPGGLDPQQYADVVAYLLKMNKLPTGAAELPAEPEAVQNVRIELPAPPKVVPKKKKSTP
jgi:S-disulfanyl-L-cysteine oxidoreductase SoxD